MESDRVTLPYIYWRALQYLLPQKRRVSLICSANVVLAMVAIAEPILLGRVFDAISEKADVTGRLIVWAALGIFSIVAYVLVARGADRLAHRQRAEVLANGFEHVITMPLAWHQQRNTSNTLHTLLRAVDTLFGLWLEFMRQHLATAVALVLLVPTALALDYRLSVVLMLLGVAYVAIGRVVMRKTRENQKAVEKHHHRVFAHVSDSIGNVAVVQSFTRIGEEARTLREHARMLIAAQYPVLDWWALASALHRIASTISMVVVLIIGAVLVTRGEMKVGEIVAFTGFASLLITRLDQITGFVNQLFEARVKLEEFYCIEDAVDDRAEPEAAMELPRVEGRVTFENVSFTFPDSGQGVKNVSFEAMPGQTIAIVGPTGAGKTTLINLLQRVQDPTEGRILIDGIDTRTVTRASLRQSVATVFQDAALFNRSIEDNIRVGRPDASYDEVHRAAMAAQAHEFILSKGGGYDTEVGERGAQLSGGERQRIAIARAILKDAPILVLDEATSDLDVETEQRLKVAVDDLRRGRTTFIIAHRLSTVRNADVVLFMDGGRIVESGPFVALARRGGRFTALLQAGGIVADEEMQKIGPVPLTPVAA
jgi:ATP-binding cassette, subfamily B, beta-glucan exporter